MVPALVVALALTILAPASASAEAETVVSASGRAGNPVATATIRRTRYGVPHIRSATLAGAGAGYGYAFAEDNVCTIADSYVTVRAERSKFFGPDGEWTFSGNSSTFNNLDSDFYFKRIIKQGIVKKMMRAPAPEGPTRGVREAVRGYVAGYNAYIRRTGVENIPDPRCRGEEWVHPIRIIDAYRRFFQLGILASSGAVIDGIAGAAPIGAAAAAEQREIQRQMLEDGSALTKLQPEIGSNAYAFGSEATSNGKGIVLGNPHFPWDGAERLYQMHLTVPGKLDVQGAGLYGVPGVLIGWTEGLAWSHTVATAWRFTPYELTLGPDPYTYLVDGELKEMKATTVSVKALSEDGELETRKRTLYETRWGPMFDEVVGIPFPWAPGKGFALRDINAFNFRYLNHFLANDKAQTVAQYDRIQRRYQGIPWVNSIAADSKGNAYYSMQGAIPYVTDELAERCNTVVGAALFAIAGLPVLDGSRSSCRWLSSPDAATPGTFPPDLIPTMIRRDFVYNGNDSHWLTNPAEPLTGFARLIGIEKAEVSFRTRLGLIQVEERLVGEDGLKGDDFNLRRLERVALGNRQYLGELWRDDLVGLCAAAPAGFFLGSSGPVDVSEACPALAGWDLRDNLRSRGAILFRRFVRNLLANFRSLPTGVQGNIFVGSQSLWLRQYDPADPVHTPGGLNVANPVVSRALADAVTNLEEAGIPLDAPLGRFQFEERGGEEIPIHGGSGTYGVFNAISAAWDPDAGYTDVVHGTSFIMAVQFKDGRCPVDAETLVAYSQSENQSSEHAGDFTKAFSRKRWNPAAVCEFQIRRDPQLETEKVSFPALSR